MRQTTVAIVGRPNVGKSTLFNRIVGGRRAIVDDRPGVTRDRNFATADWNGRVFWLVDTGGWTEESSDAIHRGIRDQVTHAIGEADAIMFVVDTLDGVHPADQEVTELLRPHRDRVLVVANKADDLASDLSFHDFHSLGLGDPVPVSAATGKGTGDLLDELVGLLGVEDARQNDDQIHVAIVGRPNVGKSSISNRLLGDDRSIVAPEAGTTRDAIDSPLTYHGKVINFIDTAGLRRRPKVKDDVEFYANLRTEKAIQRADICVMVVDASRGMERQDMRIASEAWDAGLGLIVAVNKWDTVDEKETQTAFLEQKSIVERSPFLAQVPFVFVSAVTGQRIRKLLDLILLVADRRRQRIDTAEVNRVLQAMLDRAQPPQKPGREVKLLYASQVGIRPPTIAVVSNRPDAVPESYQRYLLKGFYKAWDFEGVPIRLKLNRKRGR